MRTFGLLSHSRFFSCLLASLSSDKKLFFCIFRFFEIRLVSPSKRNSLYFISAWIKRVPSLLPSLHSSPEKEVIHSAGSFQYHFQRQLPACAACRIIKNCWHFAYKCSPGQNLSQHFNNSAGNSSCNWWCCHCCCCCCHNLCPIRAFINYQEKRVFYAALHFSCQSTSVYI